MPVVFNLPGPVAECRLYVQGHDVVCHFRHADPFHPDTGLMYVAYFMGRSPDGRTSEFRRIQNFVESSRCIGCPEICSLHISTFLIVDDERNAVFLYPVVFV